MANPDTGVKKKFDIYQEGEGGSASNWAWDGNKTSPVYFEVQIDPADNGFFYTAKSTSHGMA